MVLFKHKNQTYCCQMNEKWPSLFCFLGDKSIQWLN
uniref:Uncharacterized protein n=1 Tax=Anguilla anguilla TaxID=7936 RepID=A0A0E9T3X8_ANGAN